MGDDSHGVGGGTPLWSGRFSAVPEGELARFGASLAVDKRLASEDIAGSRAHAAMLVAQGILSEADGAAIAEGLDRVEAEIVSGELAFNPAADEDVHMAVERRLTELVGDAGKRLHTARSRNDQVATDTRLFAKRATAELADACREFQSVLLAVAERERTTLMPGYTHLQPAQPVLFAHHLLAYFWMVARDVRRLEAASAAADASPLGAGALAGTTFPINRAATAKALGFSSVIPNSMDAVSDRDFALDAIYACAVLMAHLSRLCEELVLWSSAEFGFVEMDDAHATGSSIMPQKKNPDFAELVRGKVGRVYGDLMGLLTTLKGIPLAYDKDLQEDKEPLFDALDTALGSVRAVASMVATMQVRGARMAEAAGEGFMAATDVADYLVGKGLAFREAHAVVGELVAWCVARGLTLDEVPLEDLRRFSPLFDGDVADWVDIAQVVARRRSLGGTAPEALECQLALARETLASEARAGEALAGE